MKLEFISKSREQITAQLISLMQPLNGLHGTNNCGFLALRVDNILRDKEDCEHGMPVPRNNAGIFTSVNYAAASSDASIINSFCADKRLLERCLATTITPGLIDLTSNYEIVDLSINPEAFVPDNTKVKFYKTNYTDITQRLQLLGMRDEQGIAHGFIIYTHKNKNLGHFTNFLVDANNNVYYLDAQNWATPESFVTTEPQTGDYLDDIFFIQSRPKALKPQAVKREYTQITPLVKLEGATAEPKTIIAPIPTAIDQDMEAEPENMPSTATTATAIDKFNAWQTSAEHKFLTSAPPTKHHIDEKEAEEVADMLANITLAEDPKRYNGAAFQTYFNLLRESPLPLFDIAPDLLKRPADLTKDLNKKFDVNKDIEFLLLKLNVKPPLAPVICVAKKCITYRVGSEITQLHWGYADKDTLAYPEAKKTSYVEVLHDTDVNECLGKYKTLEEAERAFTMVKNRSITMYRRGLKP